MQDRVSLYPGRVKLAPVSGQENTYDMVRADSPTQEGTPLNKDSLLKDDTAALYGLGSDAVPDDVFSIIKSLIDTNAEGIANGVKIETGYYVGTGKTGSGNENVLTFSFNPKFAFVFGGAQMLSFSTNNIGAMSDYTYGSLVGNKASWWSNGTSNGSYADLYQLNKSGVTYSWIALA